MVLTDIFVMKSFPHMQTMQHPAENRNSKQALLYTLMVYSILLLFCFMIRWRLDSPAPAVVSDLMEINLGNNADGEGDVQPLVKGDRSEMVQPEPEPPAPTSTPTADNVGPRPDEQSDPESAPVENILPKPAPNKNPAPPSVKNNDTKKPVVTAPSTPRQPKPVATYQGPGSGKGNGATEDNGYRYQGTTPGGKGDAGSPGGRPDSYGNTPGGNTGVSVTKGVRPLNLGQLRFQDDFNENAKVYLDVRYNSSGAFESATAARGTTTSNNTILSIARRKAASLKFPPSESGGVTNILFNFRVND
jgi:hypothetical protein